jgi:AraC-like DNA-binding protein
LAKIAIELELAVERRKAAGKPGGTMPHVIARGDGWTVADVVCTSGPQDRSFEEEHRRYSIAIVLAGSFQYRSPGGHGLMTPGSLMLGNSGQSFECGHEHGEGDRCVSFWYTPDFFERLSRDVVGAGSSPGFRVARLPPLRSLASLAAHAGASVIHPNRVSWEELGVRVAAEAIGLAAGTSAHDIRLVRNGEARVTRAVRMIDRHPGAALTLNHMAREAGLSPYHFLRTFERVTGVTPHQYVMRARLRAAALRLVGEPSKILDIAFDSGFGDVSNFNRAFRTEFGVSPRVYQERHTL